MVAAISLAPAPSAHNRGLAVTRYEAFVREAIPLGRRRELVGGDLIRSVGGWTQVRSLRRKRNPVAADARMLGSGNLTERLLAEAAHRGKETLRLARKVVDLPTLARKIIAKEEVAEEALRSRIRQRLVVRARQLFCQVAVKAMGYSGAKVARFLGVTTSAVNRLAVSEELPEFDNTSRCFSRMLKNALLPRLLKKVQMQGGAPGTRPEDGCRCEAY